MAGHHHHHSPSTSGEAPPRVDQKRRQLVQGLFALPAATMVLGAGRDAWALNNEVSITVEGAYRVIRCNAIPNHATGSFPNSRNPNAIEAQDLEYRVTVNPTRSGRFASAQGSGFGVAVNGVPFDPFTAEFWNNDRNWNYDAVSGQTDLGLDQNDAHVQPGGKYHYHGWPTGLIGSWSPNAHSPIIGWAADGFPIYAAYGFSDPTNAAGPVAKMTSGWRVKSGSRPSGPGGSYDGTYFEDWEWVAGLGILDQANGRETVTPDFPNGTYAYFLTEDWPIVPRYFAGTPDQSFSNRGGTPPGGAGQGSGGQRGGGQGRPPPGNGQRPPPGQRPPRR